MTSIFQGLILDMKTVASLARGVGWGVGGYNRVSTEYIVEKDVMCHEMQGKIFKQLWPSSICKKPSQTYAHFIHTPLQQDISYPKKLTVFHGQMTLLNAQFH